MLEVLDLHYGISDRQQMDWQSREKLAQVVLDKLQADPQLLLSFDIS